MKLLISALALLWTAQSLASVNAYFYDDNSFFYRPTLVVNGQEFKTRYWTGDFDIADAMTSNPTAHEFARAHQEYAWKGAAFIYGGLFASLVYSATNRGDAYNSGINLALLGAGLIPGLYFVRQSHRSLLNAVNAYNGVTQTSAQDLKLHFFVIPAAEPKLAVSLEF